MRADALLCCWWCSPHLFIFLTIRVAKIKTSADILKIIYVTAFIVGTCSCQTDNINKYNLTTRILVDRH